VDGTSHSSSVVDIPDKFFMRQMVQREFVSCVALYDDSPLAYLKGCSSFQQKSHDIFTALYNNVCNTYADCDNSGLAVHGWSQGAHIATLASSVLPGIVTAALLFGNGNANSISSWDLIDLPCMNSQEVDPYLPPSRRRSIVGEKDFYFNKPSVQEQQQQISGYTCESNNCLGRIPSECQGDDNSVTQCTVTGQVFHTNCDACPKTSLSQCTQGQQTNACPIWTFDAMTNGYIPDSAGYYIVEGQDHGFFIKSKYETNNMLPSLFGSNDVEYVFESAFLDADNIWGLQQSFDWLSRTAKYTTAIPASFIPPTQIIDSGDTEFLSAASSSSSSSSLEGDDYYYWNILLLNDPSDIPYDMGASARTNNNYTTATTATSTTTSSSPPPPPTSSPTAYLRRKQ
jgi:hypothetical protein